MKKKINYRKYIICIVFVIAFFIGLYFSINGKFNLTLSALKDIVYSPFLDLYNNNIDSVGKNLNNELMEENNSLKNIADINYTLTNFKKINATVIERNNTYWLDTMTISRGKSDGVDIGMAVVVSEGLIGKVVNITNKTSSVRLLTSSDNDNKVSVKIKSGDTYIYKILELEGNNLVVDGIDNSINIRIGEVVLTSGLSDIYPSGIIIGNVYKIESNKYKTNKKAYIKSNVDFNNLRFVSVLERKS